MTKRAILSVNNKDGLVPFARRLARLGWELIASGGTAQALREAGLEVTPVSEITGAPEMLGGRVKTLHPAVHGGLLARQTDSDRAELEAQGFEQIDMVVCNLYPFQETVAAPGVTLTEAIEQIDIGGVALLRAGAKNFERVTVVCGSGEYEGVLDELETTGEVGAATRQRLAAEAFRHTRDYDSAVTDYLLSLDAKAASGRSLPDVFRLDLVKTQALRYGENPHQAAALYAPDAQAGPLGGLLLQGKPLSYNNLLDLDAAWRTVAGFNDPAVALVKHLSPCGVATHSMNLGQAFTSALASDPVSAFGSVIAVNRPVEMGFVEALAEAELFVEAVVAPDFSPEARSWFAEQKKNCRLLSLPNVDLAEDAAIKRFEVRAIRGGYLVQEQDGGDVRGTSWEVVGRREPSAAEWDALRFAWQVVAHVRSNAIVLARGSATVGIGGGLPSRVDAVRLAVSKAGARAEGAALASDAFFPFPDGVEEAAAAGVTAIIQPGGSVRDEQVIEAANRLGLAMVFTGVRHFRH